MYERKNKEVSLEEFRNAVKGIGIEMSENACAVGMAVGNGLVRFQWSEPSEKKAEPVSPASPSVPGSTDGKQEGAS